MTETTTKSVASLLADGTAAGSWLLDPAGSRAGFHVRNFWGAITVHGTFDSMTGQASVGQDGSMTARISLDASSVNTKNKQRDDHLRSADFFHADKHPHVVLTVTSARQAGPAELECQGTLEAAGQARPVTFNAHIEEATASVVVLTAELTVDRAAFGMIWNRLRMVSMSARGTVTARFTRP